ncbi:MAG: YHYH protein [Actinobacteria bacterium]|nr:YHYH protein [Actinomycetota bacterium]
MRSRSTYAMSAIAAVSALAAACTISDPVPTPSTTTATTATSTTAAQSTTAAPTTTAPATTTTATTTPAGGTVDRTRLPIGDGKRSSEPKVGYVMSCDSSFAARTGKTDLWDNGDGTFDLERKPRVLGDVAWPQATFSMSIDGTERVLKGNDLPTSHTSGVFPIQRTDPVYPYDRNPNTITAQQLEIRVPARPTLAAQPSCVSTATPGGSVVGVLSSGVYMLSALDGAGDDAVYHEVQDRCDGHPHRGGVYHYHSLPDCLPDDGTGHSSLAGYALDGFGIYGSRGEQGETLTNAALDECHGHTHVIDWDGASVAMYHYHATAEYPYTAGCFRGTPEQVVATNNR